jgi:hypothetical protein
MNPVITNSRIIDPVGSGKHSAPVFVLGCPRSGTTLVGGLLRETRWGPAVETHFITKYYARARNLNLSDRHAYRRLVTKIIAERPIRQWNLIWDLDSLYDGSHERTYATLVDAICQCRSRELGFTGWADKTPHYCLRVGRIRLLRSLFPAAKFVFVIRDGRDVTHSLLQKPWGPNNVWRCAEYWRSCCESIRIACHEFGDSCHLIQFEKLLSDPKQNLLGLFQFLAVDSADELAHRYCDKADASRTDRWKQKLTSRQIRLFESVAGNTLQALGYETTYDQSPTGTGMEVLYRLHDGAKWLHFMAKQNVVDAIKIKFFGKQPFAE